MKFYLDCYPCLLRQALDAARMAGADEAQQKVVLDRVLDLRLLLDYPDSGRWCLRLGRGGCSTNRDGQPDCQRCHGRD